MAMSILGFTLADIREIAPIVGATVVVGGIVYRMGVRLHDKILNREFDQWLVSVTTVSEEDADGYRHLILDNLGSPARFDDDVRGRDERKAMTHAASKCTWDVERRFLLGDGGDGDGMLHVTRNALTKYWQNGVRARVEKRPVDTYTLFFAVTGGDAAIGVKKKYRVIIMNAADMLVLLQHPSDKWRFSDESHRVRLETCRKMAEAWVDNGAIEDWEQQRHPVVSGRISVGNSDHAIVGWLRAYEPALVA